MNRRTQKRWTASHDKRLIDFVRANPVYVCGSDYWDRAREATGKGSYWNKAREATGKGSFGKAAQWRWHAMSKQGVPLPPITYRYLNDQSRKWSLETVAEIMRKLRDNKVADVARQYGVSETTIKHLSSRYRRRNAKPHRPRLSPSAQEKADIALAEKAWAAFEKSQKPE